MWNFHRHHVSIAGVLMFGILQGLCGVLVGTVKVLKVGNSLDLPFKYSMESELFVEWNFEGNIFAEYSTEQNYTLLTSQFSERLKTDHDRVGLTIKDLQPQDNGTFSVVAFSSKGQYPTQTIKVYIQSPITVVKIEKSQTKSVSNNSCDVVVKCAALGAENISYLWSGYKTATGAGLQFSLSPEAGTVTLNCTAANNVSSSSATERLSCENTRSGIPYYVWIAGGGIVALFLLICLIVALRCWWRSRKRNSNPEGGNTVYARVTTESGGNKDKRSDSVVNGITLYETVDDFRVNQERTIYAKVTLPEHRKVSATSSSPYQKVG